MRSNDELRLERQVSKVVFLCCYLLWRPVSPTAKGGKSGMCSAVDVATEHIMVMLLFRATVRVRLCVAVDYEKEYWGYVK